MLKNLILIGYKIAEKNKENKFFLLSLFIDFSKGKQLCMEQRIKLRYCYSYNLSLLYPILKILFACY